MSTVTTYTYFDTSSLMRRVEANIATPSLRNQSIAGRVAGILADPSVAIGISEHTLLEFHNNVATNWRKSDASEFDQPWAERSIADVMQLVAQGQLSIIPIPPKAAEHAMTLVTIATRDYQTALRVWDAIHLLTAVAWAHKVGSVVELTTTDTDFDRFISKFPEFKTHVKPVNLDY